MANISDYLQAILNAVYGEEVRGSIYNALVEMNAESTSAMQYASTAKDSAQASAIAAAESASTATEMKANAVSAANAAAASESNAGISAQSAAASEQNAANSEAIALQKAQEANASKAAAAQSAAEAAASEETTRTMRGETEQYAAQARADKLDADTARSDAQAAKETAVLARDAAKLSEQNAKASETTVLSAKDEALQAKTDAEAANTAAQTAKNDAEAANTSALKAKADAEAACNEAAESALSARQYSGKPSIPDPTTKTWWIWNADAKQYEDTGIGSEIEGPQGIGIGDIKLTSGDHTPGSTDIYTVEMTDGSSHTISVWNGRNGEGAGDVLGKAFDLVLPATGWQDGRLTVADSRFLALSTYKYFIAADEACREKYLECNVQPRDITTDGLLSFTNSTDPETDLTVQIIRFELSTNG